MLSQISFLKQKSSGVTFGMICDAPAQQVFRDVPPTGKFLYKKQNRKLTLRLADGLCDDYSPQSNFTPLIEFKIFGNKSFLYFFLI